jgi:hypothetical protein
MKLKQALRIIESKHVIYPNCVKMIEDKIKHLKHQATEKAKQDKISASKRRTAKAEQWQEVLRRNFINMTHKDLVK